MLQPRPFVDTRVVVETPEGVDFQFVIAGPGSRALAWFIDCVMRYALLGLLAIVIGITGAAGGMPRGVLAGVIMAAHFALSWFYCSLFEYLWNGQTPGKRFTGLRVVRTNGTPIEMTNAVGRNFLRTADMLLGHGTALEMPAPVMGAEDFSYVLERVPGTFVFLGMQPEGVDAPQDIHSNRMLLDEASMAAGVALHAGLALRYLDGEPHPF